MFSRFLHVEIAVSQPPDGALKADLLERLAGPTPEDATLFRCLDGDGRSAPGAAHLRRLLVAECPSARALRDGREPVGGGRHHLFLEVGPNPVLAGSIKESGRRQGIQAEVLPSLTRSEPERETLLGSLGALYCRGYAVDWARVYPKGSRRIRLPRYPWQRETYWVETTSSRMDRLGSDCHMLLGNRIDSPLPVWEANLNANRLPYLDDHKVEGSVVFPAAGYLEAALAAQREINSGKSGVIESLEFHQALLVGSGDKPCLRVSLDAEGRGMAIHSRPGIDGEWRLHVTARLSQAVAGGIIRQIDVAGIRERCGDVLEVQALYEQFGSNGLQYGPTSAVFGGCAGDRTRFWRKSRRTRSWKSMPGATCCIRRWSMLASRR